MAKKSGDTAEDQNPEVNARRIDDVLGKDGANFYPELPRKTWKDLVNQEFFILDAKIMIAMKSKIHGVESIHDCVLIKARLTSGSDVFTTITSGEVIVNKCKRLIDENAFPIIATLRINKGKYYTFSNE